MPVSFQVEEGCKRLEFDIWLPVQIKYLQGEWQLATKKEEET